MYPLRAPCIDVSNYLRTLFFFKKNPPPRIKIKIKINKTLSRYSVCPAVKKFHL